MTAELTARHADQKRHPWDWYVEQPWVTHRLCDVVELEQGVNYVDPFCGQMTIPQVLVDRGFCARGTDLFQRVAHPLFEGVHDFLGDQHHLMELHGSLSFVMNPPFSYQDGQLVGGLAERCIRKALSIATHKVCALLPLKWLGSGGRYRLFSELTPMGVWVLCERPSMPPGDMIEALGKRAWSRGKIDYMWVVWDKRREPARDRQGRPFAPTYWIPPRTEADKLRHARLPVEVAA